jgi:non-ribosomal peptide synthetase component F
MSSYATETTVEEQRTAGFSSDEQTAGPRCVHEWIEEQAASARARSGGIRGNHLTYRELNGRANQLARFLASRESDPMFQWASALTVVSTWWWECWEF